MAEILDLNETNFRAELQKHRIAVVDYYASWCGSCRLFAPQFAEVAAENSEIAFFKVDGDTNPSTREGLTIDNLPFVAVFENGEPVGGLNMSTKEALQALVDRVKSKAAVDP